MAKLDDTLEELVTANRILANQGIVDSYGHVTIRSPDNPECYFMSRARAPERVEIGDIMEFTLEGEPIDQRGRPMYSERPIHGCLFMARPDINAVAHFHARSVLPFTVADEPLKPLFHMAAVIGETVPVWDSQPEFGDTNMLIDTMPMGHSLAKALGKNRTALIRGHGAIAVGENLRNLVMTSVYLKENAELVLQARSLGKPLTYLTPGEVQKTGTMLRTPIATDRAWDYYVARAGFRGM